MKKMKEKNYYRIEEKDFNELMEVLENARITTRVAREIISNPKIENELTIEVQKVDEMYYTLLKIKDSNPPF